MSNTATKGNANGLGSIRKRKRKRKDGTYYVFWEGRVTTSYNPLTGEQLQRTVTGNSQQAVIKRMKEVLTEGNAKEAITIIATEKTSQSADLTLKDWSDIWINSLVRVKASSVYIYKRDLALHIIPFFGNMQLQQIEKSDVKKWIRKLNDQGLAPKTVKDLHGVLHKMLEEAVEEKKIMSNPAYKCSLPKPEKPELNHFDNEDLIAFLICELFEAKNRQK